MEFGVIGYGSFGKLIASALSKYGKVFVYKRNQQEKSTGNIEFVTFNEAASKKVVILSINLEDLDEVSRQLKEFVNPETVVVDVASVKIKPIEILNKNLSGKCKILFTHPLFGPQTTENGDLSGQKIVICGNSDEKIENFLKCNLKLEIIKMSAEDHDKEMAWVHGLTFFVGRGLLGSELPATKLATGYYQKLLDLVELESKHSIELFNTVEKGNPYSKEVRNRFINELKNIHTKLDEK